MIEQNDASESARDVLHRLALKARGMSGADVERLVRDARQKARRETRPLAFADIHDILTSARPERPQPLRWRMAIHEAGHAVARLVLDLGRVTAVSIDGPAGGYTEGETPTMEAETEQFFTALLVIRLAGRAAEEEMLGSVTAGAGGSPDSDLGQATELAVAMETALGFAETSPLLYRPVEDRSSLLAYNPLLAERVSARLDAAYERARDLIHRSSDAIRVLAGELMAHDTLEGMHLVAVLREVRKRMMSEEPLT
ncbi:ATP-dependent Zn protease [Mesorhizobium sp. YM1C-6-2]|uniref:ATP-dependent Zn protease n=1 Tax=Mesorhizobium sp. YM1C-6-2 TaxID=1827501 RepID=UPI0016042029|nr:ATP-dependent Zn protease [Mesorhizobium sp. YM1C-6-2]